MPPPIRSPRSAGSTSRVVVSLALSLVVSLIPGCGPAGPPPPVSVPSPVLEPWQIPAEALGTQRLFRAHYDGPDGGGGFRLTLRLVRPDRWQAQGNALGRKLWSLEADGEEGLWIDHREDVFCRLDRRLELAGSLLAPMPFRAFPALLLGRLPEPPTAGAEVRRRPGGEIVFAGADGRRWRARVEAGRVRRWTLAQDGRTIAWWQTRGDEAILSDRRNGVQLRWRPVVEEHLARPLDPLAPPPGYRAVECRGLNLEIREGEGEPPV